LPIKNNLNALFKILRDNEAIITPKDIAFEDGDDKSLMSYAIKNFNEDMIRYLIEHGAPETPEVQAVLDVLHTDEASYL
jgi:hypothetical protein